MNEKIKLFVCDDHTLFREGVKAIFRNHSGIEIVGEAENGQEAVKKIRKVHPHVVLMDISMPVMNGIEATRIIVQSMSATRVLMLTMYDEDDVIVGCLQAGASGFVLKDAPYAQLILAVQKVSKGHRYLSSGATSKAVQEYLRKSARPSVAHNSWSTSHR